MADRDLFVHVAHGLLFSSAIHTVFHQIQDVEVLPLLFTSAAFINALQKEIETQPEATQRSISRCYRVLINYRWWPDCCLPARGAHRSVEGTRSRRSYRNARRYLTLGHDPRALFGTIGLAAAWTDATADQGHTLQIVHAAAEEF